MVGSSGSEENIKKLIEQASVTANGKNGAWQAPILSGLADGLRNRKPAPVSEKDKELLVKTFFEHPTPDVRRASLQLLKITGVENQQLINSGIEKAAKIAEDTSLSNEKRSEAINFLSIIEPCCACCFVKKINYSARTSNRSARGTVYAKCYSGYNGQQFCNTGMVGAHARNS